jgi:hypothetical protein
MDNPGDPYLCDFEPTDRPHSLFLPQGNHRIDERGAARWNEACQRCYRHQNQRYGGDGREVVGAKAIEQCGLTGEPVAEIVQCSEPLFQQGDVGGSSRQIDQNDI